MNKIPSLQKFIALLIVLLCIVLVLAPIVVYAIISFIKIGLLLVLAFLIWVLVKIFCR